MCRSKTMDPLKGMYTRNSAVSDFTWAPTRISTICNKIALWAPFRGFGRLFHILLGSRQLVWALTSCLGIQSMDLGCVYMVDLVVFYRPWTDLSHPCRLCKHHPSMGPLESNAWALDSEGKSQIRGPALRLSIFAKASGSQYLPRLEAETGCLLKNKK